jgi:hypothetical protein
MLVCLDAGVKAPRGERERSADFYERVASGAHLEFEKFASRKSRIPGPKNLNKPSQQDANEE